MNTNKEDALTLEILRTIDSQSDVTQRRLARRLGVALGLANSYLKHCVRKGLVKIQQAPANRYLYYLTPKGFAEKSRLTGQYLSVSFAFYRRAGESCVQIFAHCEEKGWRRLVFCGVSELAEIAYVRAHDHAVDILGTYDPHCGDKTFLRLPVWASLERVPSCDAFLATQVAAGENACEPVIERFGLQRVLFPSILD